MQGSFVVLSSDINICLEFFDQDSNDLQLSHIRGIMKAGPSLVEEVLFVDIDFLPFFYAFSDLINSAFILDSLPQLLLLCQVILFIFLDFRNNLNSAGHSGGLLGSNDLLNGDSGG